MHKIAMLVLVCCAGVTAHAQQRPVARQMQPSAAVADTNAPTWALFTSKEGKFAVQLPGTPQQQEQTNDTPVGPMRINLFTTNSANGAYIVGYADSEFLAKLTETNPAMIQQVLQGTANGLAGSMSGTVLDEGELQIAGYTGRQIKLSLAGDMLANIRVLLVNGRIYQMILLHHKSKKGAAEFGLFFPSFRVLP